MAQMITVVGAIFGFFAALLSFFVLDVSFMTAFAIWAASGPLAALVGFAMFSAPSPKYSARRPSAFDPAT